MENKRKFAKIGFWVLGLLWLPAGIMATAAVRFSPEPGPSNEPAMWITMAVMSVQSLVFVAPCGLPLALACRRVWRLGYARAAWAVGMGLGVITVAASLVAGLLGPIGILAYALVLSAPVWTAAWWLARRH